MQIPEKLWIQYRDALSRVNGTAAREMDRAISLLGGFSGHEEEAVRAAFALVTKYGEAAGELACEFYDAVAAASGKTVEAAIPAETATFEETAKAVYGTAKISEQQISSTVGRLVKQVGADTTLKNAQRDHAQFAWIPAGDTCAFCLTLASRGWQFISAKSMKNGHAPHIHQNCDCEYCVRFDNYSTVEGYDPDRYYEMYENAEGDTPQEKINSMRREIDARKRAEAETAGAKKNHLLGASGSGIVGAGGGSGGSGGGNHNSFFNSELQNGLPIQSEPDTVADKLDDSGKVLQRRVYGPDGMAVKDFDTTDHRRPDVHPTGAHKHTFDFSKKRPRGEWEPLSEQELAENRDIIQRGVNYHDQT